MEYAIGYSINLEFARFLRKKNTETAITRASNNRIAITRPATAPFDKPSELSENKETLNNEETFYFLLSTVLTGPDESEQLPLN